jgi:hypothetical protein
MSNKNETYFLNWSNGMMLSKGNVAAETENSQVETVRTFLIHCIFNQLAKWAQCYNIRIDYYYTVPALLPL